MNNNIELEKLKFSSKVVLAVSPSKHNISTLVQVESPCRKTDSLHELFLTFLPFLQ